MIKISSRHCLIALALGLEIAGSYFVYDRFASQAAPDVTSQIRNIEDIAPEKFADFKRRVLGPKVHSICMSQLENQLGTNGEVIQYPSSFCNCYVDQVTEVVTKSDMTYLERFKEPSPDMEARMQDARQSARRHCT